MKLNQIICWLKNNYSHVKADIRVISYHKRHFCFFAYNKANNPLESELWLLNMFPHCVLDLHNRDQDVAGCTTRAWFDRSKWPLDAKRHYRNYPRLMEHAQSNVNLLLWAERVHAAYDKLNPDFTCASE